MNKIHLNSKWKLILLSLIISAMSSPAVHAALINVTGPNSSQGVAAAIIPGPAEVTNDTVTNKAQQGFDEVQGFLNTVAYTMDTGVLATNILIDSHMIFLNKEDCANKINHNNVVWTFSGLILGVMSDKNGILEAASTADLGLAGTVYPGAAFNTRGLEPGDSYSISGNELTLSMHVSQPGDWIRVITASEVPDSASCGMLLSIGLGCLFYFRSKSKSARA